MQLVVADAEFAQTANAILRAVDEVRGSLAAYDVVMAEFAACGIDSQGSHVVVEGLRAQAREASDAAAAAVEGLGTLTRDHIAELDGIDGDLY